ncbi:FAD-dependent oxidoreductase [Ottowia sp. VDI28]|uniref:FAD-dependent oxidoreductase n=1 Tax=Ottowia sp. VDI28 TaxID=3133968 RepID=UPI003C30895F
MSVGEATAPDLIVVGAGAGGMTAALVAALEGLSVVLCEASGQVGGTTATSAGTLWLPGNRQGQAAGHADTVGAAREYLGALIGPLDPRGRRAAYLATGDEALSYLQARSAVAFASSGKHPDYLPDLPGAAVSGRAVSPLPFDGRLLRRDFERVRPPLPEFMVLGGMMIGKADITALLNRYRSWRDFSHSARLVLRYGADRLRYSRGTRLVMGNALVARLFYSLLQAGVDVRFNWRLQELTREKGRVTGARFECEGRTHALLARHGVVLATGGVGHHEMLRHELDGGGLKVYPIAPPSVRGEGVAAARGVGAGIERHTGNFFWQPVSQVPRSDGSTGLFPHLFLDRAKPGLVAVNGQGQRFVNEASSYHHFVEGMVAARAVPAYLVCEAAFIRRYGLGAIAPQTTNLKPWAARRYLTVAPTLTELARQLQMPTGALEASMASYNEGARAGVDPEFGKGSSVFDRFNGDPDHAPNPCLAPVENGPFCAMAVWPGDAASSAGLVTDVHGCVLDETGERLEGLYACGNDAASVMQGYYPGPGTTLGPAMVEGYRIARYVRGSSLE